MKLSQLCRERLTTVYRKAISTRRDLKVKDTATLEKVITEDDLKSFTEVSTDRNPVHSGEKCIVHGALLNA